MLTLYTLYIVLLFVAVIIGIALAAYAWQRRRTPGATAFAGLMLGMALYSFALAMMILSDSPQAAGFWGWKVRFVAVATAPPLLLIFAIQYTGRERWLSWPRLALLFTIPLITLVLIWSGKAQHLFFDYSMVEIGPYTFFESITNEGLWSTVYMTYVLLATFLSLVLFLVQVFRTRLPYRGQAILLLVGSLCPVVANIPDSFMMEGPRPSYTPFGLLALGLIYAWALFGYRLFDIVPVARDLVIENMGDAVLVLDERHRLVDVNPAAQRLMGRTAFELIGQPLEQVLPAWSDLAERQDFNGRAEIVVGSGEGERHIALSRQSIRDRSEHLVGYLLLLRDITERKRAEGALQTANERYEMATQAAKVGVWDWNVQTGEFYLDPNIKALLGYSDEEIPNDIEVWTTYVHPDDRQPVMEAAQAHLEGRTPEYIYEHRMLHRDGSVRWVLVRGTAIRDAQGKAIRLVGTDTDITKRKQAEDALQRAHDELEGRVAERTAELAQEKRIAEDIINSLPGAFYIYDEQARLIRWNNGNRKLTGYSDEEALHKHVLEFIVEEDRAMIARSVEQVFGEGFVQVEAQTLTKAGDKIPMFLTGVRTTLGGQPVFMGYGIDITQRKKLEAELEAHRDHLEDLVAERTAELRKLSQAVEQSASTVIITDQQGRIEYANPRFEETTGYTVDESLGQNPRILKSSAHDEAHYRELWETITSGQTWRGEFYNKRKDGSFFWEHATIAPLIDESGQITNFVAVKDDITQGYRSKLWGTSIIRVIDLLPSP